MVDSFSQQKMKLKGFFKIDNNNVYIKSEKDIYELDNDTMNLIHKIAIELNSNKGKNKVYNDVLRYLSDLGISIEMSDYWTANHSKELQGIKIGIFGDELINSMLYKAFDENLDITVLDNNFESVPEGICLIVGTSFIKLHDRFKKIHRLSMERNIPWLKFSLSKEEIILGPIFVPGSTACYECYLMRILANIDDKSGFTRQCKILNEVYNDYVFQYKPSLNKIKMAIAIMIDSLYAFLLKNDKLDIVGKEKKIKFHNLNVTTKTIFKIFNCDCRTHYS